MAPPHRARQTRPLWLRSAHSAPPTFLPDGFAPGDRVSGARQGRYHRTPRARFEYIKPEWETDALCRELASMDRVAAARVMVTDVVQTSIQTREKSMRSKDGTFAALLVIEGLDETSVRDALRRVPSLAPQLSGRLIEELPLCALCFTLDRRLLPS